jgi:hypothetical protein
MTKDKKKETKKPTKKDVSKKPTVKKEVSKKESTKKEVPKAKTTKSKLKEDIVPEDDGIIVVEDNAGLDKEAELEARKAYLEEARSQEASDD